MNSLQLLCFSVYLLQFHLVSGGDLSPSESACVRELHLERAEIEHFVNEDIVSENNPKFNNFLECYWQKMGWQAENGEIEYHILKVSLPELLRHKFVREKPKLVNFLEQMLWGAISDCEHRPPMKGSTHGETAVRVQNCIMRGVKNESSAYLKLRHFK